MTALRFEDVWEGMELPPLTRRVSLVRMMMYGAATWDYVPLHYDAAYAQKRGFPAPVADGQMLGAYLCQLLTDWSGDPGSVRALSFRNQAPVFPGDTLVCKGKVSHRRASGKDSLVDCDLWIENQRGEQVVGHASATLSLPSGVRGPQT